MKNRAKKSPKHMLKKKSKVRGKIMIKKYECWGQNGGAIVGHDYIYKSSDSCNLD